MGAIALLCLGKPINLVCGVGFELFNRGFQATARGYAKFVGGMLRVFALVLLLYGGVLGLTYWGFLNTPRGFIPSQDMGYLLVNIQLPDSASLERTQNVIVKMEEIAHKIRGRRRDRGRRRAVAAHERLRIEFRHDVSDAQAI